MGIREMSRKGTAKATDLNKGDTFKTLQEREPHIISIWVDENRDDILIAISLLTGESRCIDYFDVVIPVDFMITEE